MPISALALSYLLLGEQFKWIHAMGFGIVLASIFLATHKKQKSGNMIFPLLFSLQTYLRNSIPISLP